MRAGAPTVRMLSNATQVQILRAMAGEFRALTVPDGYAGEERPQRRPRRPSPEPQPEQSEDKYRITPAGRARLPIADGIELWLLKAPGGPLAYADPRAEQAIELLADAWGSGLAHALAAGPIVKRELIAACDPPPRAVKRLLADLQRVGMVEAATTAANTDALAATGWLRRGIGPLALAARTERTDPPPGAKPVDEFDIEAAMLLVAPLLRLDESLSGACRLVVRLGKPGHRRPVGVTATVGDDGTVSCERGLDPDATAEAVGGLESWFAALIEQQPTRLRFDGDRGLACALVAECAAALFDEAAYAH